MKKNVRDLEVCSGFPLRGSRVVELNVLAEALDGGCEACGAALRLSNCIKETAGLFTFNVAKNIVFHN